MDALDRRQFGRAVSAGLVGTFAASASAADDPPADATRPEIPPTAPANDKPPPELLLLGYLASLLPPERLTDDVLRGVIRDLRGDRLRGEILAAFPLRNSDEPGVLFAPFRAPAT